MARQYLINKFDEYDSGHNWTGVYQRLTVDAMRQERSMKLTYKVAHSLLNVEKNRYRDVAPYDSCRMKLKNLRDDQTDYINASPLTIPGTNRRYILSQGPLYDTCNDFWQMCWENECPGIIMLNKVIEKGDSKCEEYYPTEGQTEIDFETFHVLLLEENANPNYTIRRIRLTNKDTEEFRDVTHMQYTEWPDFGVPQSTEHFLEFLDDCRSRNLLSSTPSDSAPIVHCSAGIGRTGTFVVCDGVLHLVEKDAKSVDVEQLLVELRRSRVGLIQTPQQFRFCWKSIADRLRKGGEIIQCEKKQAIQENKEDDMKKNVTLPTEHEQSCQSMKRRRESEKDDEIVDDHLAKRRALVARMVAKSRQAEEEQCNGGVLARFSRLINLVPGDRVSYAAAGAIALTATLLYLSLRARE